MVVPARPASPATIYDLLTAGGGVEDLSAEQFGTDDDAPLLAKVLRKASDVARSRRYPGRFEVVIPDMLRCQSTVEPRGVVNVAISGPGGTHHWNLGPADNGNPANVAMLDRAGDRRYRQRALWEWHGTTEDGERPDADVCGNVVWQKKLQIIGPNSAGVASEDVVEYQHACALVSMTGFVACDVIVRDYYADCMYAHSFKPYGPSCNNIRFLFCDIRSQGRHVFGVAGVNDFEAFQNTVTNSRGSFYHVEGGGGRYVEQSYHRIRNNVLDNISRDFVYFTGGCGLDGLEISENVRIGGCATIYVVATRLDDNPGNEEFQGDAAGRMGDGKAKVRNVVVLRNQWNRPNEGIFWRFRDIDNLIIAGNRGPIRWYLNQCDPFNDIEGCRNVGRAKNDIWCPARS